MIQKYFYSRYFQDMPCIRNGQRLNLQRCKFTKADSLSIRKVLKHLKLMTCFKLAKGIFYIHKSMTRWSNTGHSMSTLPIHFEGSLGSMLKPRLHEQVKLPGVLAQICSHGLGWSAHSSMSGRGIGQTVKRSMEIRMRILLY